MLNWNDSFEKRQSEPNLGEQLFEQYCEKMGYNCRKIGFDEKQPIKTYSHINPMLRNIPDYLVITSTQTLVVQVKGTANFKKIEVDMIPLFMEWYSSSKAPLVYAFCFKENDKPIMVYPEKIIELYQKSTDRRWSDGVIYRNLAIGS